jgi:hypothetical protein
MVRTVLLPPRFRRRWARSRLNRSAPNRSQRDREGIHHDVTTHYQQYRDVYDDCHGGRSHDGDRATAQNGS